MELVPTVDFEQPRALYNNVMNDTDREHLVSNIVDHVRGVKSSDIKSKIRKRRFTSVTSVYLTVFDSLLLGFYRPKAFGPHCQGSRSPGWGSTPPRYQARFRGYPFPRSEGVREAWVTSIVSFYISCHASDIVCVS